MIDNLQFAFDGAWRVLLAGLVFGAGLPVVFALGIRSLRLGSRRLRRGQRGGRQPGRAR